MARLTLLSVHAALFYCPGDRLSLAELGAARLDGDVVEVGEGFMPADTIETSAARALSLSPLVPATMAATGATAAWVHGAGDRPPAVHHFCRTQPQRLRVMPHRRMTCHDRVLDEDEVELLSGVAVTTPLATATTLLFGATTNPSDEAWLRALLRTDPGLLTRLSEHLTPFRPRPGKRKAEKLLAALLAQEVVTR